MPYFRLLPFVNNEQYGEGEMSRFLSLFAYFCLILYLIFLLWESVENDQPLLCLLVPFLFLISLILCTLLYFLIFIIIVWSLLKAKLTVDPLTAFSPCV